MRSGTRQGSRTSIACGRSATPTPTYSSCATRPSALTRSRTLSQSGSLRFRRTSRPQSECNCVPSAAFPAPCPPFRIVPLGLLPAPQARHALTPLTARIIIVGTKADLKDDANVKKDVKAKGETIVTTEVRTRRAAHTQQLWMRERTACPVRSNARSWRSSTVPSPRSNAPPRRDRASRRSLTRPCGPCWRRRSLREAAAAAP